MEQTQDREISILDLCYFIFKEWRKIILFAFVGVIIFAGLFFYKNRSYFQQNKNVDSQSEKVIEGVDYALNIKAYEDIINENEKKIKNYETYSQKSVLMNIDPYNKPVKEIDYYITLDDETYDKIQNANISNPSEQIAAAYASIIEQKLDYDSLSALTNLEIPYLKEIISIKRLDLNGNTGQNKFTITIVYDNDAILEQMSKIINDLVKKVKGDVTKASYEHQVEVIEKPITRSVDTNLLQYQIDFKNKINTSLTTINNADTALTKAKKQGGSIKVLGGFPKKKFLKYVIIGAFLGFFFTCLVYFLIYIFNGKIHTADELKSMYNFDILSIVLKKKENKKMFAFFDRWLQNTMRKLPYNESCDDAIQRISIMLAHACKNEGKTNFQFVSTNDTEEIKLIVDKIIAQNPDVNITYAGNPISSIDATKSISEAENIVLIETLEESRFEKINAEVEIIKQLKKNVFGYVVSAEVFE